MPLYEYQCTRCREVCELLQKAGDKPLETCPLCGGPMVKRISPPALQFKGNGWYVTDYAKKGAQPAKPGQDGRAKTEAGAGTPSGSGDGAKTKPDKADKPAS
ncbi:MAG TPA: zinc ribbon domain-containing protein [Candidatus Aminicenantes bacterium]|nr:zinc ribbon domain-containing protein [Candidatus Aminicenantes bacterium]HDT13362.1 zinc ribbon domain-containing protein [Candidatus Aminicenantes bacterium]